MDATSEILLYICIWHLKYGIVVSFNSWYLILDCITLKL